ncbi:CsgG/HfaB family protein [Candidatus Neomarinimicrobiota bacterium]
MIITARESRKFQSLTVLFMALALISQNGCTAGVSSVRYDSDVGDRNSIPAKADITVNITGSDIHWRFQAASAKRSISTTIQRDLEQNIFYGGDKIALKVNVNVDKLGYREEQWYWLSWMVYPFYLFGMPLAKATGAVEASLEISTLNDDLIGSYRSSQYLHKWYGIYNLRSVFPSTTNQGGITKDALQLTIEDLKDQFLNDRRALALANDHVGRFPAAEPRLDASQSMSYDPVDEQAEKLNVAVIDLDAISISVTEAVTLTNRLRVELFRTGRFMVLERSKMNEILDEQGFQETGCTTSDCLVEVGQLLNMQQMVSGSVSKFGEVYSIELRIFDVATGVIVGAAVEDVTGSLSDVLTSGMHNAVVKLIR